MILGKVRIQNFKSIIDSEWVYLSKNDLVTILAGQNESGKTSFLRALRYFEEGRYTSFEDEDLRIDTFPRVDAVFYLTDKELLELKKNTNKEIAEYYQKNGFRYVRGELTKLDDQLKYIYSDDIKALVNTYNEKREQGMPEFNVWNYFNTLRPPLVFYSSFMNNILPGKAEYNDIPNNQAILDFQKIYNVHFQELLGPGTTEQQRARKTQEIREKAADSLNSYWSQKISGEEASYRYNINLIPQIQNINLSYVNFYIDQEDGMPLKISQKSQGFQWFSGFILRLRAHEEEMEERGLILLIDEPGQGLHENAQQDVKNVIEEIADKSKIQIIYTTHQPILLGKENVDFSRLLLVDRDKVNGSKFKTIAQLVGSQGSLDALAPIRTALGLVTISDPLQGENTVVVEGVTEYFYLKTFIGNKYFIIPSTGVDQVPNIFAILFGWGVNTKIIVDDDMQGRKAFGKIRKEFYNDQESDDFRKTIWKTKGYSGIEEFISKNIITELMLFFDKEYDISKSKLENINTIGKLIFAKSFFDRYFGKLDDLDEESRNNFNKILLFLES